MRTQFIKLNERVAKKVMDVFGFAKGVYVITITSENVKHTLNFIKE